MSRRGSGLFSALVGAMLAAGALVAWKCARRDASSTGASSDALVGAVAGKPASEAWEFPRGA